MDLFSISAEFFGSTRCDRELHRECSDYRVLSRRKRHYRSL